MSYLLKCVRMQQCLRLHPLSLTVMDIPRACCQIKRVCRTLLMLAAGVHIRISVSSIRMSSPPRRSSRNGPTTFSSTFFTGNEWIRENNLHVNRLRNHDKYGSLILEGAGGDRFLILMTQDYSHKPLVKNDATTRRWRFNYITCSTS